LKQIKLNTLNKEFHDKLITILSDNKIDSDNIFLIEGSFNKDFLPLIIENKLISGVYLSINEKFVFILKKKISFFYSI
jgi:hypothetical protein